MLECSVQSCQKYGQARGDHSFKLPHDHRREGWIKFLQSQQDIQDEEFIPQNDTAICSLHFEKRLLLKHQDQVHLSSEAYPRIYHTPDGNLKQITSREFKIEKFCRFCFNSTSKFLAITDLDNLGIESNQIFVALQIKHSYKNLPQIFCSNCFVKIKKFWNFKKLAKKAEEQLINFYKLDQEQIEIKQEENGEILDILQDIKEEDIKDVNPNEFFLEDENCLLEDVMIEEELEEEILEKKKEDSDYNPDGEQDGRNSETEDFHEVFSESETEEPPDLDFNDDQNVITSSSPKVILKKFKCKVPACGLIFGGKKTFEQHDCGLKEYKCDKCPNKIYQKRAQLISHIQSKHNKIRHSQNQTRKCPMCKKLFKSSERKFKIHKQKLCPERGKPILCEICFKYLPTLSGYQTHTLYHKNDLLKKDLEVLNSHVILPTNNLCNFCGTLCETANDYMKHLENAHQDQLKQIPCPDPDCKKTFSSQRRIYGHYYAVHKKDEIKCEICGKLYKNKFAYNDHKNKVHGGTKERERLFKCLHCDKSFFRNDALKVHTNSHTRALSWDCDVCDKSFTTKYQLNQHSLKFHERNQ